MNQYHCLPRFSRPDIANQWLSVSINPMDGAPGCCRGSPISRPCLITKSSNINVRIARQQLVPSSCRAGRPGKDMVEASRKQAYLQSSVIVRLVCIGFRAKERHIFRFCRSSLGKNDELPASCGSSPIGNHKRTGSSASTATIP